MAEQAAYDVGYYLLDVKVLPEKKMIEGSVLVQSKVVQPLYWFVLDLDTVLSIHDIKEILPDGREKERIFKRDVGKVWIDMGRTLQPGEQLSVQVTYSGVPREAKRAPWDGVFTWDKTKSGDHWIATTCQGEGADTWWPCKDHVSDEPDSMDLFVNVPSGLTAACNGRMIEKVEKEDSTTSFHWFISMPINIYNVSLNIAPYVLLKDEMTCIDGSTYPVEFYVLPSYEEPGKAFLPEIKDHLAFHEKHFGPYPFRADKYGVVMTPHLGMEHQSIIAYGSNFKNGSMIGKDWGFDELHHHELAHEWWGNMVTNSDWKDAWIHEGFGTYSQVLYVEEKQGFEKSVEYLQRQHFYARNPVIHRTSQTASGGWSGPIYSKGAHILHTLRYIIGESNLRRSLRFMAYPDQSLEKVKDGGQCRFVNTDDFINIAETYSGKELNWLFEMYGYQKDLPKLTYERGKDYVMIGWDLPKGTDFPMPVEVKVDKKMYKLDLKRGPARVKAKSKSEVTIDPNGWLMFELVDKQD